MNIPSIKVVVLASLNKVIFYEARGLNIIGKPTQIELDIKYHSRNEKREGYFHKRSVQGAFFDPHTSSRDLEHDNCAREIIKHLEARLATTHYDELVILLEPKLLGCVKQHLKSGVKKMDIHC